MNCNVKNCEREQAPHGGLCEKHAQEKHELEAAVSEFADRMRRRLVEKLLDGYAGWWDPKLRMKLALVLEKKAARLRYNLGNKHEAVDAANLAMMLEKL